MLFRGIGKALLNYSENIAYEMADKLFLVVADYNPAAKRFYERNGGIILLAQRTLMPAFP